MLKERFSRHFFVVHKEASLKREPPEPRPTESMGGSGCWGIRSMYANVGGQRYFLYCHWVAESEEDVCNLEEKVVNSRASEMHQFMLIEIYQHLRIKP